jgi:hypothetical protein
MKSLLNQLKLAYSPLNNRDFATLKGDLDIQNNLRRSSLYLICQRPELFFKNIRPIIERQSIYLEIQQEANPSCLKIELPILQDNLAKDPNKFINTYFGSHRNIQSIDNGVDHAYGLKFYESDEENKLDNFIAWFSPEKLIQNIWLGIITASVTGNIRDFTRYNVHYIGKATDQEVWKRLTGHATLQDILSIENPITWGSLPTHEISLLFFYFQDNMQIESFSDEADIDEMVKSIMGESVPKQKRIFLDAEKALIRAMTPKYNKELFKNYPVSKDGLYNDNFDTISYTFTDPITLVYETGEIQGGLNKLGGDSIIIESNSSFRISKVN